MQINSFAIIAEVLT